MRIRRQVASWAALFATISHQLQDGAAYGNFPEIDHVTLGLIEGPGHNGIGMLTFFGNNFDAIDGLEQNLISPHLEKFQLLNGNWNKDEEVAYLLQGDIVQFLQDHVGANQDVGEHIFFDGATISTENSRWPLELRGTTPGAGISYYGDLTVFVDPDTFEHGGCYYHHRWNAADEACRVCAEYFDQNGGCYAEERSAEQKGAVQGVCTKCYTAAMRYCADKVAGEEMCEGRHEGNWLDKAECSSFPMCHWDDGNEDEVDGEPSAPTVATTPAPTVATTPAATPAPPATTDLSQGGASTDGDSSPLDTGAIVGISLGAVVFILVAVLAVVLRKQNELENGNGNGDGEFLKRINSSNFVVNTAAMDAGRKHSNPIYTDTRELSTATAEEVEYEGDGTVAADGFAADYVTPEGNFESFAAYTVKNTTNATDAGRTTTNPVYTDDTEEPQYVTTAQQAGSGGGETLYGTNDESPVYEQPDALNENPEYVALATQDTAVSQVLYAATN